MAKNKVQFQQGYSLADFFRDYGTDDQCEQALLHWRWPEGFVCPNCHSTDHCELKCRKLYQCNRCHQQTSLTSGTIFACFSAVTAAGCEHVSIVTDGGPDCVTMKEFTWVNTMLGNVKNAISGTYHSVGGRHKTCLAIWLSSAIDSTVVSTCGACCSDSPAWQ